MQEQEPTCSVGWDFESAKLVVWVKQCLWYFLLQLDIEEFLIMNRQLDFGELTTEKPHRCSQAKPCQGGIQATCHTGHTENSRLEHHSTPSPISRLHGSKRSCHGISR